MNGLAIVAETDGRSQARTSMFIAAAMTVGDASTPVKIRDMSSDGALVETSVTPALGNEVTLARGRLLSHGVVVWSVGNRFGVRFSSSVNVREWMTPPSNPGQIQVDAIVNGSRGCQDVDGKSALVQKTKGPGLQLRLASLTTIIEELADALAEDPITIARHGIELQKFDKALQLLNSIRAEAA